LLLAARYFVVVRRDRTVFFRAGVALVVAAVAAVGRERVLGAGAGFAAFGVRGFTTAA